MDEHTPHIGERLVVDMWGIDPKFLTSTGYIDRVLQGAANEARATIIHAHVHSFEEGTGVTSAVILHRGHILIHTWPEFGHVTLDIFMCGKCDPNVSINFVRAFLYPKNFSVRSISVDANH